MLKTPEQPMALQVEITGTYPRPWLSMCGSLSATESWWYVTDVEGMLFGTLFISQICPLVSAARRARGLHSSARPCCILVMPRLTLR
jgi:hypothetical protein